MRVSLRHGGSRIGSFVWPALLLAASLTTAAASSIAGSEGLPHASLTLLVLALTSALGAGILLLPRLLIGLRLDFLSQLRFFRLTRRGGVFVAVVLLVGFSAANTGNNLLVLVLSALVAAIIVSGTISNIVLHGLKISLNLPESIHAGQQAMFFLTLENLKTFFPSFALRLRSRNKEGQVKTEATNLFVQEKNFPYIRPGEKIQVNLLCEFRRRGILSIDGFEVTTTFPFGFFSRGRKIAAEGSIVIYPELRDLGSFVRSHPYLLGTGESPSRGWGSGLYNIRPFRGGDSTRFIHWKSSAKVGQLMVKDFVSEVDNPLNLVFSTFLPGENRHGEVQFEKAVSYVASVASLWNQRGNRFHFYSGEFEKRVAGEREAYEELMEYLACVEPSSYLQLDPGRIPAEAILFCAGSTVASQGSWKIDYLQL